MKKQHGFTLIEVILVLVIVSMLIMLGINYMQQQAQAARVDKTSLQMQQILNAGLAFYVLNGRWPAGLAELQSNNILPQGAITNPWGQTYTVVPGPNTGATGTTTPALLYVYTNVIGSGTTGSAFAAGTMIAGKLPLAFTTPTNPAGGVPDQSTQCITTTTTCYIAASVNIPGQNLNNASAVNFAGVYHHGACIPVPQCPIDNATGTTMQAQVFLVPISVSGLNDASPNQANAYAITSFTAKTSASLPNANPPQCTPQTTPPVLTCGNVPYPSPGGTYWRACMNIVTEKGTVIGGTADASWGGQVSMAAFTRCSINREPAGSNFFVWTN